MISDDDLQPLLTRQSRDDSKVSALNQKKCTSSRCILMVRLCRGKGHWLGPSLGAADCKIEWRKTRGAIQSRSRVNFLG
jgi:hypothetical protein